MPGIGWEIREIAFKMLRMLRNETILHGETNGRVQIIN